VGPNFERDLSAISALPDAHSTSGSFVPIVQTQYTSAEVGDLEKASGHHDILEEMDGLVLVCKVVVKKHGRHDAPQCKDDRHNARLKTYQKSEAAENFDKDG